MPNVGTILKEEITRLARKEIRVQVGPTQERLATLRKAISAQKSRITTLEKELARVKKDLGLKDTLGQEVCEAEVKKARLSPKNIANLRKKLGLSRNDMALILGVNANSIYLWEQGKAQPRIAAKSKLVRLRGMGKRCISKLLKEQKAK